MTELEKRLVALYLVVDATVADDVKDHVMAAVKERDRYREALEELKEALTDCTCDDPEILGHESVMCQLYFVAEAALDGTVAERASGGRGDE